MEQVRAGAGASAQTTGLEVKSPDGDQYQGWKVKSPKSETIVLEKQQEPVVIVIYPKSGSCPGSTEQRRLLLSPFRKELAQNNPNQPGPALFPVQLLRSGGKPKQKPVDVIQ